MTVAITLIHKVQRIPDVTAVQEALSVVQTQSQITARETALALENIKAEIKSNTEKVYKSIAIGKEARIAAKEATDLGETMAGMARELKNSGTQVNANLPMSHAAAAASGTIALSMHNTPAAKTSSTQVQREVVVNIRNALTIHGLRAMIPRSLRAYVGKIIEQGGNERRAKMRYVPSSDPRCDDLTTWMYDTSK